MGGAILVIEDQEPISSVVADLLQDEGYRVACVPDGASAFAFLAASPTPGLMILDLNMPVMDGREFLARCRTDARLAAVPVVVISADAEHAAMYAARHGTDYLVKPFKLTSLLDLVARHCGPP